MHFSPYLNCLSWTLLKGFSSPSVWLLSITLLSRTLFFKGFSGLVISSPENTYLAPFANQGYTCQAEAQFQLQRAKEPELLQEVLRYGALGH